MLVIGRRRVRLPEEIWLFCSNLNTNKIAPEDMGGKCLFVEKFRYIEINFRNMETK